MAVADALDEIRMRNERLDRAQQLAEHRPAGGNVGLDDEVARQDREDEEASRQAFRADMDEGVRRVPADDNENDNMPAGGENASSYSFGRSKKKKKDYRSALGIKRK
ncbi:mRNA splicing protein Yju2 [Lasiodiplodia theobromae]|nr:mRNA splicing protein Yju2 [Lasiodiplodia theobromae]